MDEQNREPNGISIFARTGFWIARRLDEENEGMGLGSVRDGV